MVSGSDLITAQSLAEALDLSVETIWRYTRYFIQLVPI